MWLGTTSTTTPRPARAGRRTSRRRTRRARQRRWTAACGRRRRSRGSSPARPAGPARGRRGRRRAAQVAGLRLPRRRSRTPRAAAAGRWTSAPARVGHRGGPPQDSGRTSRLRAGSRTCSRTAPPTTPRPRLRPQTGSALRRPPWTPRRACGRGGVELDLPASSPNSSVGRIERSIGSWWALKRMQERVVDHRPPRSSELGDGPAVEEDHRAVLACPLGPVLLAHVLAVGMNQAMSPTSLSPPWSALGRRRSDGGGTPGARGAARRRGW